MDPFTKKSNGQFDGNPEADKATGKGLSQFDGQQFSFGSQEPPSGTSVVGPDGNDNGHDALSPPNGSTGGAREVHINVSELSKEAATADVQGVSNEAATADVQGVSNEPAAANVQGVFDFANREINHPRETIAFLMILVQVATGLLTNISGPSSSPLSPKGRVLNQCAVCCSFIGIICLVNVLLVGGRLSGSFKRILSGIGYTATIYGLVLAMGMLLEDSIMLWITAAACIVFIPALLSTFCKQKED